MKMDKRNLWFVFMALCAWPAAACLVPACGGGGGGDEDADADAQDGDALEDGADVPEICQGLDLCDSEGVTCEGNTLVTCAENADGCLVETREDCTAVEDGYCDDASDPPECGVMDPCEGIEQCAAEGRACEADILVVCSPNANACLVETRTDCTESDGGFCNEDLDPPACDVNLDPCADVTNPCTVEGRACDGDVLVVCGPDAFDCLVETRTDCAATDFVCDSDSDPVACVDPCTLVDLCAEPVICDGALLVTCAEDENGCLVRDTEVDCSADGMICDSTLDPPACAEGSCMEAMRINCASGTVNADTSDTDPTSPPYATTRLGSYSCTSYSYPGNEFIFLFTEAAESNVVITSTRLASSGDFDLYALDGTSSLCAEETLDCLDSSTGTSATEEVSFHAAADQPVFIVYDIYSDASATTAFTLDVHCVTCGDGSVEGSEQCDDGDTDDGDGCSSGCQVEPGWVCDDAEPSSCRETTCGDSLVEGSEECDDGGTDDGDGCSAMCTVESGWFCLGEPSVCWSGGDTCSDPIRVSAGTYEFDTTPYANDYDDYNGLCGTDRSGAGPDMVFVALVPANSIISVVMADLVYFDEALVLATDCADITGSCVVYSDPGTAEYHNTTGADQAVYIVADGYSSTSYGPFSLEVEITAVTCGDGLVMGAEECDDGGTADGDGCSAGCTVETGWFCGGEPSFCWSGGDTCSDPIRISPGTYEFDTTPYANDYDDYNGLCGTDEVGAGPDMVFAVDVPNGSFIDVTMIDIDYFDEALVLATDCADITGSCVVYSDPGTAEYQNTSGGDQTVYIVADGYYSSSYGLFSLDVQVAAVVCGDGIIVGTEECDDGNAAGGDGCSAACTVESGWHCGGEPSFCWNGGETCDDPVRITAGSYIFSTAGYASDYDDYMGDCSTTGYTGPGPDLVLTVNVPAGQTLSVTMDGLPSWDEVVVIASACPDVVGSCRALADLSYEMPAQVTNTSGSDMVYYIVADGYFSYSLGDFSLDVTVE